MFRFELVDPFAGGGHGLLVVGESSNHRLHRLEFALGRCKVLFGRSALTAAGEGGGQSLRFFPGVEQLGAQCLDLAAHAGALGDLLADVALAGRGVLALFAQIGPWRAVSGAFATGSRERLVDSLLDGADHLLEARVLGERL